MCSSTTHDKTMKKSLSQDGEKARRVMGLKKTHHKHYRYAVAIIQCLDLNFS